MGSWENVSCGIVDLEAFNLYKEVHRAVVELSLQTCLLAKSLYPYSGQLCGTLHQLLLDLETFLSLDSIVIGHHKGTNLIEKPSTDNDKKE